MKYILLLSLIALCMTHPTVHDNFPRNQECLKDTPPEPYSWHFHVIYDRKTTQKAHELREKMAEILKLDLSDPKDMCDDLIFIEGKDLCAFEPVEVPLLSGNPFLQSEFAFLFLPNMLYEVLKTGVLYNTGLDILIHPNTGCAISDHTFYVLYGGHKRELDITIFGGEGTPIIKDRIRTLFDEHLETRNDLSDNVRAFLERHDHQ